MIGIALARRVLRSAEALPPVRLVGAPLYERHFARAQRVNLFRGVYPDFAAAIASAPMAKPLGYDHPAAAAMYRDRMTQLSPSDYPALFWVARLLPEIGSVFDFGGHVGLLCYALLSRIAVPPTLRWVVHDVPEVMAQGRQLAASEGNRHLAFADDVARAADCDLFFASGSLQYVDVTLDRMLAGLGRLPRHVIVNLTPLHERHAFVTLQNIGTAFCPYAIRQRSTFVGGLEALGYRVVDRWDNPEKRCTIPFHPAHSVSGYDGMVLTLR